MGRPRLIDWHLTSGTEGTAEYRDVDNEFITAITWATQNGLPWPLVNTIGWVIVTDVQFNRKQIDMTMFGGKPSAITLGVTASIKWKFDE